MAPLAVDLLEAPDLVGDPLVVLRLDVAQNQRLALALDQPSLLQVLVGDVVEADPAGAALDVAKEPVRVLAPRVVEAAALLGAHAAGRLVNVNVPAGLAGLVGRVGRRLVLVGLEGQRGGEDALAHEVADALDDEAGLARVGVGVVLSSPPGQGLWLAGRKREDGGTEREGGVTYDVPLASEVLGGLLRRGGHGCGIGWAFGDRV